jgi:SAM-dependent methyltransferase
VAPDGTPVAPFMLLPATEADLIHGALPPTASILELGCGAGRVTWRLAELGHFVIGIDQSIEMIRHVAERAGVTVLRADIETLSLDQTFEGVVLASYLVNVPDRTKRFRFLAACRRHVADDGAVVIQRLDPEARWTVGAESTFGPVRVRLAQADMQDQIVRAQLEYQIGDQIFPQAVIAEILGDITLDTELSSAGLRRDRWIDEQKTWLVARPC